MPRGTILSSSEQANLDLMKQMGVSIQEMSKRIGRTRSCIRRYLQDPRYYGTKSSSGRPRLLTARDERAIVKEASNSMVSAKEIRARLKLNVSGETVRRVLHRSPNIVREKMKRAPFLSARHIEGRMKFAEDHMATDWERVSFSIFDSNVAVQISLTRLMRRFCLTFCFQ